MAAHRLPNGGGRHPDADMAAVPWIVLELDVPFPLRAGRRVLFKMAAEAGVGVGIHRPHLQDAKPPAAHADPLLRIQR